jgi:hypothetical protein
MPPLRSTWISAECRAQPRSYSPLSGSKSEEGSQLPCNDHQVGSRVSLASALGTTNEQDHETHRDRRAHARCHTRARRRRVLLASGRPGQGSSRDFAVGTGLGSIGRVSFAAHGGPFPDEPVTGHFHAKGELIEGGGEFDLQGPVTCLHVIANKAGLFYPVRDPDPAEPRGVFVYFEDRGNGDAGDTPDGISFLPLQVGEEIPENLSCEPKPAPFDLTRGNIAIHDNGI